MSSFSWSTDVDGTWNTGTLWTPATVPNDIAADVTIDAAIPTARAYTVSILSGTTETVHSLTMNDVNGRAGTNNPDGYFAAELLLDGTLAFAPGSAGALDGSLQTYIFTDFGANASIVNGGTLNAFIQVEGNLVMTGTNAVYITNEIQALGGTVTIDTPIATMRGSTLFDGIFQAKGLGATMRLGGGGNIVNITKIEGPQDNPPGWTELTFADPKSVIEEWNGSGYVSVETSLREISGGGTVDVTFGRNLNLGTNPLTIDNLGSSVGAGMLNMAGVTVTTGGITINGGVVQGYGTIASDVINNGTMIALGGAANGTLDVAGTLSGTGTVLFDQNIQSGSPEATKGTLVLHGVSSGQTITVNSGDTLVLANPRAFAGTIADTIGGTIVLEGITATSATLNNGTLVVSNGAAQVATLALSGSYSGAFTANGSIISLGTASPPTISGATAGQTVSDAATISPFSNVVIADPDVGQTQTVTVTLSTPANGTLTNLGGGSYNAATGVYTVTGAAAAVTSALDALVFAPTAHQVAPGQTVTTGFTISGVDSQAQSATDSTTSVIVTAANAPPTISGTLAGQAVTDQGTITPFAAVVIADANIGQAETVTVSLSSPANGTLTNLSSGNYDATTGVYTATGTAGTITAALDRLTFVPTRADVPGGQTVTTTFTIGVADSASASATDSTTSVVATAVGAPAGGVMLKGSSSQYVIASNGGTLYVADSVANRNGVQTLPGTTLMAFADGTGVFDPTGSAENVARLYMATLGRAPDVPGLQFWAGQMDNAHVPLSDIATSFTNSPEFIQDYGTLSNNAFVQQLYQNVLGRPADTGGLQFWGNQLASGASRGAIVIGFSQSPEYEDKTLSMGGDVHNAEAYRLYVAGLGRAPDADGEAYWSSQLAGGATSTAVAQGFVNSAEFQHSYGALSTSDFVSALYQNVLHRTGDQAGMQYWTNLLGTGTSQASVIVGFADSLENRAQTAAATHANWVFVPG
jgi:hypothetical protein